MFKQITTMTAMTAMTAMSLILVSSVYANCEGGLDFSDLNPETEILIERFDHEKNNPLTSIRELLEKANKLELEEAILQFAHRIDEESGDWSNTISLQKVQNHLMRTYDLRISGFRWEKATEAILKQHGIYWTTRETFGLIFEHQKTYPAVSVFERRIHVAPALAYWSEQKLRQYPHGKPYYPGGFSGNGVITVSIPFAEFSEGSKTVLRRMKRYRRLVKYRGIVEAEIKVDRSTGSWRPIGEIEIVNAR